MSIYHFFHQTHCITYRPLIFLIILLFSFPAFSATLLVPSQAADLQTAITQANDGDIIELAAGTYAAPNNGFRLENNAKSLTIRAASGATVSLNGGGKGGNNLLWFGYDSSYSGKRAPVTFEGITFLNGYSTTDGIGAGVTMLYGAAATFKDCIFQGNLNEASSTGGGAATVGEDSTAFFINSQFNSNYARNEGAGLSVKTNSTVYVHNSTFTGNQTNLSGHRLTSAGGAIHVGDSKLRVSNSRFENNQAGYVAGAIFAIGTYEENWTGSGAAPGSDVIISNSTFIGNRAQRDGGNSFYQPTEAGAFHAEDKTQASIYSSRFEKNFAMDGGAVNLYRATIEVHDSVFLGNYAIGAEAEGDKSLGGTFSVLSNDASDITTGFGVYNRPPGSLTVSNSYVQGRYDTVTTTADVGGCLYSSGDSNRLYGENSLSQNGNTTSNRATVAINQVVFNDCDITTNTIGGSGVGGAIALDLVDITIQNSLIINSDATGSGSSGGAIAIFNQSTASLSDITIASNSAAGFGAGIFVQGSHIELSDCNLIENEFSPLVSENSSVSYGAALFSAPYDGNAGTRAGIDVTGSVTNCVISNNVGLAIFDDDRTNGPINSIVYNDNTIYADTFGSAIYTSKVDVPPGGTPNEDLTVAELNSLVVTRNIGISTTKSSIDNTAPVSAPVVAKLIAAPDLIYNTNASGDPTPPTTSYLAYAWSGSTATLNSSTLSENSGVDSTTSAGLQDLTAADSPPKQSLATVTAATSPSASLSADSTLITGGDSTILSWIIGGDLLDIAIDQGVSIDTNLSSVSVSPSVSTTYTMHLIAKQGGTYATESVTVENGPTPTFTVTLDDILLSAGQSTNINYTATEGSNVFFEGAQQPLTTATVAAAPGNTTEYTLYAANGFGTTEQVVTIHVNNGEWPIGTPTITQPIADETLITGTVTLGWNPVSAATGYYLEVWDAFTGQTIHCEEVGPFENDSSIGKPHCPSITKTTTLATSTQVTLETGNYIVAVRACDKTVANFQRCGLYATQIFELQGVLLKPTIIQPSPSQVISVKGITFSWSAVSGSAGYGLEITDRTTGNIVFSGSLLGENSNFSLVSLPDGQFTFAVRACTSAGFETINCSTNATVDFNVILTAPTGTPTIVTPLANENLTSSTQNFSWTTVSKADESQALFYEVVIEDVTDGTTALQISVFDPDTSTIATLPSSTNYRMKIRACQAGCGEWSTAVNFSMTLEAVPTTAPTITSAVVTGDSLTTNWSAISGADLYQIQVIQPTGGPGGSALTVAAKQVATTSATLSVPTGEASVIVQACTGDGCGPFSGVASINPSGSNPLLPNMGTPLAGTYVDGPLVNFSWSRIPGDDGSNTTYRLFVQDLSRQSTALDVYTTDIFYAAYFKAEGARYDSIVIANPGASQVVGPPAGFNVKGLSSTAPTMVQPAHQSSIKEGNIQLGWTPVPGATLYEYFVAVPGDSNATVRGVTPGLVVQVALSAIGGANTPYSGIVRACPAGATCAPGSDSGWGDWSVNAGPGVTNFTITP